MALLNCGVGTPFRLKLLQILDGCLCRLPHVGVRIRKERPDGGQRFDGSQLIQHVDGGLAHNIVWSMESGQGQRHSLLGIEMLHIAQHAALHVGRSMSA